jgi:hypothetical protein
MQPVPFGKYLLLERLAHGGMAEVFRAVFTGPAGFEKTVALKRILPGFEGAAEFRNLFVDEARIASQLTHVNIAQVFDFGEIDDSYYLTMELVQGADLGRLRDAARRRGVRFPLPIAAFIVAEAARGLAYAHDQRGPKGTPLGIVHRDVSPQNVLLSYSGEVKIADFGIAKAIGKLHKTASGIVQGKLRYMSPEQVQGEPLDGRSDLFSLGVVLWELAAGVQLFDGEHPGRVIEQVKSARIDPPSARAPDVPAEIDRIVLKLLTRARDTRYDHALKVARELQAWAAEVAPALTREDVGAFVAEMIPRPGELAEAPGSLLSEEPVSPDGPTLATPTAQPQSVVSAAPTEVAKRRTAVDMPATRAAGGRRALTVAVALIALAAGGAAIVLVSGHATAPPPPGLAVTDAAAKPTADDAAPAPSALPEGERLALIAELEGLPQAAAAWRGVPSGDYLDILSAVDASVCTHEIPGEALARVNARLLGPETRAVARYLERAGSLPPRVALSLEAFLRSHPAYSPGSPGAGWAMARLAARLWPNDARWARALIHQNGALAAWRPPGSTGALADLCEREAAVNRYRALEPGAHAERYLRFLHATPADLPLDAGGLRWVLLSAERDEAAATLTVRLRLTNPGADERPLALEELRLFGADAAPTVDPPAPRLSAGMVREIRVSFSGVSDAVAEAAVLLVRPGAELQAYSEDLR